MIEQILCCEALIPYLKEIVEENGVGADFHASLLINGCINPDQVCNISVDSFYNTEVSPAPKSIDNLVITKKSDGTVSLYLIELRNVKRPSGIRLSDILPKFDTTINNFIKERFPNLFISERTTISKLNLWLVAAPQRNMTDEKYERFFKSQLYEQYLLMKPLRLGKHASMITFKRHDPRPVIR